MRTADVPEALQLATTLAKASGALIVVTGSLFVAGEARGLFCEMPMDPQMPVF
jgi:folylpolyglutamate synthase/dihydropteroate synthase